jgi:hypothetical protein
MSTLVTTMTAVLLAVVLPAGAQVVPTPLQTRMVFDPPEPTDIDRVDLLLAHRVGVCGWYEPEVVDVRRTGFEIRVDIESAAGFEGGLPNSSAESEAPDKCSPAVTYLFAQKIELGALDPGTYGVSVYLTQTDGFPEPITVLARHGTLQVTDAGNEVLLRSRFRAEVTWTDFDGNQGEGKPVPGASDESTLFTFFDDGNWELMLKVLDGCSYNGHYWVFGSAATNVEYTLTVTDVVTGSASIEHNPLGSPAVAFGRIDAFPCD